MARMATKKTTAKKTTAKKTTAKKTTAKKTRAAPKRAEVVASWAEGYGPLVEAARERFAFLRDLGFAEPEVTIAPPSAMITFARGADFVRIESEYAGEPFASVRVGPGAPAGLHTLIAGLEPAYIAQKPAPAGSVLTPDEMRAAVAYQAAFLGRHPEILRAPSPA
jgi:hypothetical protein